MFVPRTVSTIVVPADVYSKPPTVLLDTVAGEKMVGLLTQIGQLAEFAADIFNSTQIIISIFDRHRMIRSTCGDFSP